MATITENDNDAGADIGTAHTISLGDSFQGTLAATDDVDWVRVELDAGTIYDISQTSGKDVRLSLLDADGNYVFDGRASQPDDKMLISPDESGTYYIGINNRGGEASGQYEISLIENTIPIGTYDDIADYLTTGGWEAGGIPPHSVDIETGGVLTANITALTEYGQQLARWALEAWTSVTGITFEFVEDDSAYLTFDDDGEGAYADQLGQDGIIISTEINIPENVTGTHRASASEIFGSEIFTTYLHETGHALGFAHPGNYGAADVRFGVNTEFLIDSFQATAMSYIDQARNTYIDATFALSITPMIADIIAIQNLYGVPEESNGGDTVYGYRSNVDGYLGEFFSLWTREADPFILTDAADGPVTAYHAQAFADLDGDGDPDMVIGNHQGEFRYFENTGAAGNPEFTLGSGEANPLGNLVANFDSTPVFADLDGDGDVDLVNGHNDGTLSYIENTGSATAPVYTQRSSDDNPFNGIDTGSNSTPALADLDGDGDLDLVAGNFDGDLDYFENTGTASAPAFTQRSESTNPLDSVSMNSHSAPELADLDGDGDIDLVLWGWYGAVDYYENTGSAAAPVFEKRSDAADPLSGINFPNLGKPSIADLDGDGDVDLVVRDLNGTQFHYFENDGTDAAPDFISARLQRPAALTLYDTGGTDTLDVRTDRDDQRIDLRPEGISDVYGLIGNLVIARDVLIENAIAGRANDVVIGNSAANRLEGRAGNDNLHGLGGNDTLNGDAGDDTLYGGPGADMLDGGAGSDTVSYLNSSAGVLVRLHDARAVKLGEAEGDTLTGIEHLVGSEYNDTLAGDGEDNILEGGNGDDLLYGGPAGGDDTMSGGNGDDRIFGGRGNDILTGGEGSDYLKGGPGEDTLIVDGNDMDVLYGGPDQDTFRFFPSDLGGGSIGDFTDGEDVIDLTAFTGINSMDDLDIISHGDNVQIEVSGTEYLTIIILSDFDVTNLDNSDFLF